MAPAAGIIVHAIIGFVLFCHGLTTQISHSLLRKSIVKIVFDSLWNASMEGSSFYGRKKKTV